MMMFSPPGIIGGLHRQRRSRERDSGILQVSDNKTKALLKERDAQIVALEKEVLMLRNKIATLSKEQPITQRVSKRQLTPYGTMVRVSISKCSAKRRQVGCFMRATL